MSKFLAPIHGWLFNKIRILEQVEKQIESNVGSVYQSLHDSSVEKYGDYLPNQPIEEIIDQTNIHGWLQQAINKAESRQAYYVSLLLKENLEEEILNAYYEVGKKVAQGLEVATPNDALNGLNNVLLEGMPCDRVNEVVEQDEKHVKWLTKQCVHKNNWESNGTPVTHYYDYRAKFSLGFVEALNKNYGYNYTNDEQQVHEIKEN